MRCGEQRTLLLNASTPTWSQHPGCEELASVSRLRAAGSPSCTSSTVPHSLFWPQIADEFKVVVVEAIKALCLKFPQVRCSSDGL